MVAWLFVCLQMKELKRFARPGPIDPDLRYKNQMSMVNDYVADWNKDKVPDDYPTLASTVRRQTFHPQGLSSPMTNFFFFFFFSY